MEGCYDEAAVAEVIQTPITSTNVSKLSFQSKIEHWFYANLDIYGTPEMITTTEYQILDDGSLQLTRSVLRKAWWLKNVIVKTWNGSVWVETTVESTQLVAKNYWHRSMTSYFEGWSPFNRSVLPTQSSAAGEFTKDGYQFWTVEELGGWAMVSGTTQAVAVVFGKTQTGQSSSGIPPPNAYFNKKDYGAASGVVALLPCVESDWPDNSILTQTLVIVPGATSDVT